MKRTTEQIRGIYDALSKADLEDAFENYTEAPTALAWTQLLGAMLVFQQWQQVREKSGMPEVIWHSPLSSWQDTLMQQVGLGQDVTEAIANCSK